MSNTSGNGKFKLGEVSGRLTAVETSLQTVVAETKDNTSSVKVLVEKITHLTTAVKDKVEVVEEKVDSHLVNHEQTSNIKSGRYFKLLTIIFRAVIVLLVSYLSYKILGK